MVFKDKSVLILINCSGNAGVFDRNDGSISSKCRLEGRYSVMNDFSSSI